MIIGIGDMIHCIAAVLGDALIYHDLWIFVYLLPVRVVDEDGEIGGVQLLGGPGNGK